MKNTTALEVPVPFRTAAVGQAAPRRPRLPLWLKLAYTAFMAVLVPVYWANYGPTNFLYFCDLALFTTLAAVWTESALLAGMAAVGIVLPQMLWCADFAGHFAGMKLTGMTDYMFDSRRSLFLRGLSLFHGWLPFLLLGLVARLGYDRRALRAWTATAWIAMLVSFFFMPQPGAVLAHPQTPVNINYVFGMSDAAPQSWMPPLAWLGMLMVGMPVLLFWPTHRILKRFFKPPFAENSRDSVRRLREDCAPSLPPCSRASGQPSSPPTFP